jgi:HlyD family secretion protein
MFPRFLLVLLSAVFPFGCTPQTEPVLQGYAEGDYVRVGAPFAGSLSSLYVQRGAQVKQGDPLYVLEQESEKAARQQAEEQLKGAEAQLANLQKGKRPDEVAAAAAQLAQAEASLRLSEAQFKRDEKLIGDGVISKERLDRSRSALDSDRNRVSQLSAQLRITQLGARIDEIRAAEAQLAASKAMLAQAQWKLDQKSIRSPVTGFVQDTFYVQGEWVNAGNPVVSLLPPGNIKVRFFIPEVALGKVRVGQAVKISCDSCGSPIRAAISYISSEAEYTPPVIYSKENRGKLVYLAEARPDPADAVKLHPGQPVDVRLP